MRRALAALTVAAYLTLVIDAAGGQSTPVSLIPGALFLLAATAGFWWVERRGRGGWPTRTSRCSS